jgi:cation diffusion facilitator family transporter
MDCPSEERMIRLAFEGLPGERKLEFDLSKRQLTILHEGPSDPYLAALVPLNLGSELLSTEAATFNIDTESSSTIETETKTLKWLLVINAGMFVIEFALGWIAESTGLIADSLDMFADAAVYSLSLFAVKQTVSKQKQAAKMSGYFQILLALFAIAEVIRRFAFGSEPEAPYMIGVAALALAANVSCLFLLHRHKEGGAHMKASWIFSTNDVIANCGVILAGVLVYFSRSNIPDFVIGLVIGAIVLNGGFRILKVAA